MPVAEQRRRSNQLISHINVTGFVSIMVVLLYLVMGPSMIVVDGRRPNVDLPKVSHPVAMRGARREDAIIIGISNDGIIWFGSDKVELSELPGKIREAVKSGSPQTVYFKADARAKYRYVSDALEAVRKSGLEKIVFLVEQRKLT